MSVHQVRKRMKSIRKSKGLRGEDVAMQIGVSRSFYTQLESGTRGLSVIHLFKIAKALKITIGELCGDSLDDKNLERMSGHLIPVNNHKMWKILTPLFLEETEDVSEWIIVLHEATKKMKQLKKEREKMDQARYSKQNQAV